MVLLEKNCQKKDDPASKKIGKKITMNLEEIPPSFRLLIDTHYFSEIVCPCAFVNEACYFHIKKFTYAKRKNVYGSTLYSLGFIYHQMGCDPKTFQNDTINCESKLINDEDYFKGDYRKCNAIIFENKCPHRISINWIDCPEITKITKIDKFV